jgi:tetratricopeptide (TPR) repeat protein
VCHGKLGESALGGPAGAARVVEAEGLFRRAIALRPDLPDAYFNLGTALAIQGRHAEAEAPLRSYMERVPVALLRNALVREPDAPGLRSHLVQALRDHARGLQARGRSPEAEALLAEARALESGRPAWR